MPARLKPDVLTAVYALLAVGLLICSSIIWEWAIVGRWYYCADWIPFMPDFFFPPFAHPNLDAGDWYAVDERLVYSVWGLLVIVSLAAPQLLLRRYLLMRA